MKKLLMSILMLGALLFASSGFATIQSYSVDFTLNPEADSQWSPMFGNTWEIVDSVVVPGIKIYKGVPETLNEITAASRVAGLELVSTGISITTIFMASTGGSSGIFFGASPKASASSPYSPNDYNVHTVGVFEEEGVMKIDLQEEDTESIVLSGATSETIFKLELDVDISNTLSWVVYGFNSAMTEFSELGSGSFAGLSVLTGGVGVFTEGSGTGFSEFSVQGEGTNAVPVPGAVVLLGMGLVGLAGLKRRQI